MSANKNFYITTAIDYPNGTPHMGHAYEKVITDAYARWYRLTGHDVFFLTGTDENGQKLVKSAHDAGAASTGAYIDEQVMHFRKLCKDLAISNDDFIRTTEKRHHDVCKEIWLKLEKKGDIFFDKYSGQYCLSCEAFYLPAQAPDNKCPSHGTPLELIEEEGFFFKMSKYHEWIVNFLKSNPGFVKPEARLREVVSRLDQEPLRDLSISRPNQGWGIPTPSKPNHVMYTWFDALINYYAATAADPAKKKYWPAQSHVIGKDIIWFHAVIWPIMLHAADLPTPEEIYVHGMVLAADGRKMSKSLNNGVNPQDVISTIPVDSFRYYLLRSISSGQDGPFSKDELIAKHNSELANDLGNLSMRVVKLAAKRLGASIDGSGVTAVLDHSKLGAEMDASMREREHNRALDLLWSQIIKTNVYVNDSAPWKLKEDAEFKAVIYNCLYAIHCFATVVAPFMPEIARKMHEVLGTENMGFAGLKFGVQKFTLMAEPHLLFPKIENKPVA